MGLIKREHDKYWLLPLDQALEVIRLLSKAKLVHMTWQGNLQSIKEIDEDLCLKLTTDQHIKEKQLEKVLNP
jgi:hypothetical protein